MTTHPPRTWPAPAAGAPVAIVGAGFTGLAAAALLAGQGQPVVVFDRCPRVGGVAAIDTLDGMRFCPGPQYFWGFGAGGEGRRIVDRMGLRLPMRQMAADFDHLAFGDGGFAPVLGGWRGPVFDGLLRRHPEQAEPLRRFVEILDRLGEAGVAISRGAHFMDGGRAMLGRILRCPTVSREARKRVLRHQGKTVAGLAAQVGLAPALLRAVAYHQGIFAERLDALSVMLFAAARHHLVRPLFVPRGGPLRVVEQLVARARSGGARFELGASVEAVQRKADGLHLVVRTAAGINRFAAAQVVFACAPPVATRLMPELRVSYAPGHSVTALCLALQVDDAVARRLADHNFTWYRAEAADVDFEATDPEPGTLNFASPTLNGGAPAPDGRCVVVAYAPGDVSEPAAARRAEARVLGMLHRWGAAEVRARRAVGRRQWRRDYGCYAGAVYGRRLTARSIRQQALVEGPDGVWLAHSGAGISGLMGCLEMAERAADEIVDARRLGGDRSTEVAHAPASV